jgi:hypothetical protein
MADHLMGRLKKYVASMPDPEVTVDRAAVAWAMRGGSSGRAPAPATTAWSKLSDKEFSSELGRQFGFGVDRLT